MPEQVPEFNQQKRGGKTIQPLYEAGRKVLRKWDADPGCNQTINRLQYLEEN
jgi:hypothetical protein